MTREEAAGYYHMERETLLFYESTGLLDCVKKENGGYEYQDLDPRRAELIPVLLKAGMEPGDVRTFLLGRGEDGRESKEDQLRLLRKCRCQLLEEIHARQQVLDQLDYCILEFKRSG